MEYRSEHENRNVHQRHHLKLTEVKPNTFQWICANPKDIPPDDLDDEILGKMVKEADAMYRWQLKVLKGK